jgi:hypothetical protein
MPAPFGRIKRNRSFHTGCGRKRGYTIASLFRLLYTKGLNDNAETHLSTEQSPPRKDTRFSFPNGNKKWEGRSLTKARTGAPQADGEF